jgi:hypothetical protein
MVLLAAARMNHWYLCACHKRPHTAPMRLPPSSSTSLATRLFFIASLIVLVAMLPVGALASTPQLVCSPSSVRFGTVTVNQSLTQVVVLTNTGKTSATVSAISVSGSEFGVAGIKLPLTLAAGQSATLNATFSPSATGWVGEKVTFTSTASNSSFGLAVRGVGVRSEPLTATPGSISFNQVAVGSQSTVKIVLTNPHAWSEILSALQPAGAGFSVSGPTFPLTLKTGQSVSFSVTFAPQSPGLSGGRVFVAGPSVSIPLTGTGTTTTVGVLSVSPASLNFGKVMIGETGMQTAVLSANGTSVTISSAASNNGQFSLPGSTFPVTIPAGQSVQVNVAFSPQSAGTASAKLTFASDASNSPASEGAAGTGTAPQVSLAWSASTSQVQGYNVYRGIAPGVYSKINGALDQNTSYTDTTVAAGQTYYYAATAVSASGQESSYSAPVTVAVP